MHPDQFLQPVPVSTVGLDPIECLVALKNRAGVDAFNHEPDFPWDIEALERGKSCWCTSGLGPRTCLDQPGYPLEYLRMIGVPVVIKCDRFDAAEYDQTNGVGAAQQAIDHLRSTGSTDTRQLRRGELGETKSSDCPGGGSRGIAAMFGIGIPASIISGGVTLLENVGFELSAVSELFTMPLLAVGVMFCCAGAAAALFDL